MKSSNQSLALSLAAIVVGMLLLSFASAPLYSLFCRVTGFGGTTQVATKAPGKIYDREVTIRFNADTDPALPWDFKPDQVEMKVKVGENHLAFYSARNEAKLPLTGTSVYNVTPHKAGIYFDKIQCFCFTQQQIGPGEKVTFPVSFFIDPEFLNDPNMRNVQTITLSYTFFPVKESDKITPKTSQSKTEQNNGS